MHIANPDKAVKIRWVVKLKGNNFDKAMGVMWCSCGYRNNFKGVFKFKCSECGKALDVMRIAKDPAHIKRGME